MSCSITERVSEERTKSGFCRFSRVFSNNFSSGSSSKAANNSEPGTSAAAAAAGDVGVVSEPETPADNSAASSTSVVAQTGNSAEAVVSVESASSEAGENSPEETGSTKGTLRCKPRCLCWCYCCSCICVTPAKGKGSKTLESPPVNELLIIEGEPIPTLEEIRAWGKSFDTLMTSPVGRNVFGEFLKLEYSDENILFWLACEDLKLETDPEIIAEKVRVIYEGYVSILSPKEVSLDSHVREIVNRNMVEPTTHTFDEAQMQIYMLMMRDSYPRFVNSALYKSLAQEPEQEATEQEVPEQDAPSQEEPQPSGSTSHNVDNGKSGEPQSQV